MSELNINVLKARAILGMVEESTTVHRTYLLDDETFCKLIQEYAHTMTTQDAADRLAVYVNENY